MLTANVDYQVAHPNEVSEFAKNGSYVELVKRVTEETVRRQGFYVMPKPKYVQQRFNRRIPK